MVKWRASVGQGAKKNNGHRRLLPLEKQSNSPKRNNDIGRRRIILGEKSLQSQTSSPSRGPKFKRWDYYYYHSTEYVHSIHARSPQLARWGTFGSWKRCPVARLAQIPKVR